MSIVEKSFKALDEKVVPEKDEFHIKETIYQIAVFVQVFFVR